ECRPFLVPFRQRFLDRFGHGWPMASQLVEKHARPESEYAAVPAVVAVGHESLRGCAIRLLDEALDLEPAVERRAAPDVAIAGLRSGCGDAQGHQPVLLREIGGRARRLSERHFVGD